MDNKKVLVFGSNGWIGGMFKTRSKHTLFFAKSRPEEYMECSKEIEDVSPDTVISFIGRTHGTIDGVLINTIDYLEYPGKLKENLRDNYIAPMHLADICEKRNIQYVYLGTGCIYTYTNDLSIATETTKPNFFGSGYSTVKGYTDTDIRRYSNTLMLRIRMPITKERNDRNFIDKLVKYPKVCSIDNSMTVLDDFFPIIDSMISNKETGVYNFTNPGVISHQEILELYKKLIDKNHKYELVSYETQIKFLKSERSNIHLSTSKIEDYCSKNNLIIPNIKDSISNCISNYKNKMKIAKHICFYFLEERIKYINKIINETNNYEITTDIFIHTNKLDLTIENFVGYSNGCIEIVYHDLSDIHPYYLTWKPRELLKKQRYEYDIFMYIEDDILVPFKVVRYWLEYNEKLINLNFNLGFLRIEIDKDGTEYITDLEDKRFDTISLYDEEYFINSNNPYCAFWIYNKNEFNKFIDSKYYNIRNINGNQFREASAIGLHGLYTDWYEATLIPFVDKKLIEDCKIYHLPNNYIGDHKFASIKFDEITI